MQKFCLLVLALLVAFQLHAQGSSYTFQDFQNALNATPPHYGDATNALANLYGTRNMGAVGQAFNLLNSPAPGSSSQTYLDKLIQDATQPATSASENQVWNALLLIGEAANDVSDPAFANTGVRQALYTTIHDNDTAIQASMSRQIAQYPNQGMESARTGIANLYKSQPTSVIIRFDSKLELPTERSGQNAPLPMR